ncbi:hypothetical protein [Bremerella alba]|uniref:Uncharacterized protein n=1 Tax=Bremerella alba TaxID=980252 RepID=A0A7V9A6P4_9BACT|nr:hypothetical protein [Bremerella alba]MBA2114575.1 hypothetical protein [Bremerella alba]
MLKGQSFPLIFLMLLVAFSAILARIAMPIVQSFQTHDVYGSAVATEQWVSWSVAMVVTGAVVGFIIGWIRESFWPGAIVGLILGSVIGAACTPFLAVPTALTALCDLAWIFISLILLAFGTILIERRSRSPQDSDQYVKSLKETPEQS